MRSGGNWSDVRASALSGSGKRGDGPLDGSGMESGAPLPRRPVRCRARPRRRTSDAGQERRIVSPESSYSGRAHPNHTLAVIVQGKGGNQAAHAVADVLGL